MSYSMYISSCQELLLTTEKEVGKVKGNRGKMWENRGVFFKKCFALKCLIDLKCDIIQWSG